MKATGLGSCAMALVVAVTTGGHADDSGIDVSRARVLLANVMSDTDQFGNVEGRGSLTEKAKELGLSDLEVAHIRGSTGFVICLGTTYGNPSVASGALVASKRLVVTAGHVFVDQNGHRREPLSDCFFAPQIEGSTDPQRWQMFHFNFKIARFQFSGQTDDPNDYAVVALETPAEGAVPFQIDPSEVARNAWVLGLTATQKSPTRTFDPEEPIIQQCRVRGFQHSLLAPVQYITDCDLSLGGSGGPVLTRDDSGRLVVRGILVDSGKDKKNGQAFNPGTGSYTRVIGTTGLFAKTIHDLAAALEGTP